VAFFAKRIGDESATNWRKQQGGEKGDAKDAISPPNTHFPAIARCEKATPMAEPGKDLGPQKTEKKGYQHHADHHPQRCRKGGVPGGKPQGKSFEGSEYELNHARNDNGEVFQGIIQCHRMEVNDNRLRRNIPPLFEGLLILTGFNI